MVADLEQIGPDILPPHRGLGRGFRVAGQQHPAPGDLQAQHDAVVVLVAACPLQQAFRRMEDGKPGRPNGELQAPAGQDGREPPLAQQLEPLAPGRSGDRASGIQHGANVEPLPGVQDRVQAPEVVVMGVCQYQQVDPAHVLVAQVTGQDVVPDVETVRPEPVSQVADGRIGTISALARRARAATAVHQQVAAVRQADQAGIPLAHVDECKGRHSRRRRRPQRRHKQQDQRQPDQAA
jgi:hypothetical protein